jgi:hypothetical protein
MAALRWVSFLSNNVSSNPPVITVSSSRSPQSRLIRKTHADDVLPVPESRCGKKRLWRFLIFLIFLWRRSVGNYVSLQRYLRGVGFGRPTLPSGSGARSGGYQVLHWDSINLSKYLEMRESSRRGCISHRSCSVRWVQVSSTDYCSHDSTETRGCKKKLFPGARHCQIFLQKNLTY